MPGLDDGSQRARVLGVPVVDEVAAVREEAPSFHRRVSGHLLHPAFIRMGRDAGQFDLAALQVDEEQDLKRHQSAQGEHLDAEEVGSGEHRQVRADEGCPGRSTVALWSWRHTVAPQNVANRLIRDIVAEVGQGADDSIIAPVRIVFGHAYD